MGHSKSGLKWAGVTCFMSDHSTHTLRQKKNDRNAKLPVRVHLFKPRFKLLFFFQRWDGWWITLDPVDFQGFLSFFDPCK